MGNTDQHDTEQNDHSDDEMALSEGELQIEGAQRSVVMQPKDISLFQYKRWFDKGSLNLNPDWQRDYVWKGKRPSIFVESLLMKLPIPVIFLAKTDDQKYNVIDGVQRLTTVFNFLDNKFKLQNLSVYSELNGKYFKDLEKEIQSQLEDTTIACFELASTTSQSMLFTIFERINRGAVSLNEMEIRNCIYRGKLNDKIKELAKDTNFRIAVNMSNISDRMMDRSFVLRFLAFYQNNYKRSSSGLKTFLNDFFESYRDASGGTLSEFDRKFRQAMKAAFTVFGDKAFRLRRDHAKGGGEWAARANASIFQVVATSLADYDQVTVTRNRDAIYESYLDLQTDQRWIDAVTRATGDFANIKYAFETWNTRLANIIGDNEGLDANRLFSASLKSELYKNDPTCKICGQKIASIDDSAVDHIEQYWRGGKTIPSNARLVHRLCNQTRARSD